MNAAILFSSDDDFDRALAIVRALAEDAPLPARPVRGEGQSGFILTTKSYEKLTKHLGGIAFETREVALFSALPKERQAELRGRRPKT